jgi:hypothetical protein
MMIPFDLKSKAKAGQAINPVLPTRPEERGVVPGAMKKLRMAKSQTQILP